MLFLKEGGRSAWQLLELFLILMEFQLADGSSLSFKVFSQFMGDGAFHVVTGYDHVLFLLFLLLPAVVSRAGKKWVPESSLRRCSIEVLKIVTAFTVAHSVTMGLAAFKILTISSSIIEPVIAASIVVAALNNLWPYLRTSWLIAGIFGLVHGFGFASSGHRDRWT